MASITQGELFARVPHWLIDHPRCDPYVLAVYVVLSKRSNNATRNAYPGMRRIANEGHMSLSTVQRVLAVLEEIGALEIKRQTGLKEGKAWHMVNRYHLPPFPFGGVPPENTPGVSGNGTGRVASEHRGVPLGSTELDGFELDELTRELEKSKPEIPPRLPGESRAAHAKRIAGT